MSDESYVLWNASASRAAGGDSLKQELIAQPGVRLIETASSEDAQHATEQAIAANVPRVIAAGGDGTVSAVAKALVAAGHHNTALAILPLGTGNDLARTLEMPLALNDALTICLEGEVCTIDAIQAAGPNQDRLVFNMATAGNTGRFADTVDEDFKRQWGVFSYVRAGLTALSDLTTYDIEVGTDGSAPKHFRAINVFIANGRTSGGGVEIAPEASLTDGLLDYVIVLDGSIARLTALAADYVMNRLLDNDLIVHGQARQLKLRARPDLSFSTDGESIADPLTTFSVKPACLRAVIGPHVTVTPVGLNTQPPTQEPIPQVAFI